MTTGSWPQSPAVSGRGIAPCVTFSRVNDRPLVGRPDRGDALHGADEDEVVPERRRGEVGHLTNADARQHGAGRGRQRLQLTGPEREAPDGASTDDGRAVRPGLRLSLIHISEPTRLGMISYAVFCLKKKK